MFLKDQEQTGICKTRILNIHILYPTSKIFMLHINYYFIFNQILLINNSEKSMNAKANFVSLKTI